MATTNPTPEQPIELPAAFWRQAKAALEAAIEARHAAARAKPGRARPSKADEKVPGSVPTEVSRSASGVKLLATKDQVEWIVGFARANPDLGASKEVVEKLGKRIGDATNQAAFRARRHELGQKEVRGIWADPELHVKVKQAAAPHVGEDGWIAGLTDGKPARGAKPKAPRRA